MKTIYIVGVGMNSPTARAESVIASCEVLVGDARLLDMFSHLNKPVFSGYLPQDVLNIVENSEAKTFAVLVSGDVGFYSGAKNLIPALKDYDVRLTAGVSSVCEFFAKLKLSWQDAAFVSMHGSSGPLVSAVRRNRHTFCLTGGNTVSIGETLQRAGFGMLTVHVGENLGYPDESVYSVTASQLGKTRPMTVLLIVNDDFDKSVPSGLPDDTFLRADNVPMTKSEVRAVVLSKLRLSSGSVCYDIGAGTGSVSAEMALSAYNGHVYAIERNAAAGQLVLDNCKKLHIGNLTLIEGDAAEVIEKLPVPDAVFIGGSGGRFLEIVDAVLKKNRKVRLIATAIALETAMKALKAYEEAGIEHTELIQLGVLRAVKRGDLHMLTAQNPIFVISGGGV